MIPKPFSEKYWAFLNWWISEDEANGIEIIGILQFKSSPRAEDPALVITKFVKL